MASLRLPIVINREIAAALKRVAENTRIPVATLARDAIIDMLAEHGETIVSVPRPGGNRHKIGQDEPTGNTMEQDRASAATMEQDKPVTPLAPKQPAPNSPAEIIRQRKAASAHKGLPGNGRRGEAITRNGNGAEGE